MKFRALITACLLIFCVGSINAETEADLLYRLQWRIGEPDTGQAFLPDTALKLFLNMAQDKVVRFSQYLPKQVDITYDTDSMKYALPADFKKIEGVMAYSDEGRWYRLIPNPYFQAEHDSLQYFVAWEHPEQAELYLKGIDFYDGMTVRVFYRAKAPRMTAATDSCYVPGDIQVEIIEEAASYYEHANRNYQAFQLLNQSVRVDMGILKQ